MQTAPSDDWKNGFAKRADNFPDVCARGETWRWSPGETVARVAAAVLKGTPALTIPQRMTLLIYVEHLNQERLEQDVACVWPSTALVAEYLGCSQSQARANRRALEVAGFLVRDYTRANRPAGIEAYDLRPLMARLDELEQVDDGIRAAMEARRASYSENVVFPTRYSARAPESRRLEQSHENFSSPVRGKATASPRHQSPGRPAARAENGQASNDSGQRHESGQDRAIGSPGGASGFGGARSDPTQYAEMVRQELRTAAQVCPRVAPLVTPALLANPFTAAPELAAKVAAAAAEWLPNPERNNDKTAIWGWRKHGARILVMLAIALEDPEVKSPCGYFGFLAGQSQGASDLRLNLSRILRTKGAVSPPVADPPPLDGEAPARRLAQDLVAPPGTEDPKWLAIALELKRILKEGKFGSWFSRVGFEGVHDGVLMLTTPSRVAADRIRAEFIPDILRAAEAADVFVERVVITLRKP